jgi:hypothetical protein
MLLISRTHRPTGWDIGCPTPIWNAPQRHDKKIPEIRSKAGKDPPLAARTNDNTMNHERGRQEDGTELKLITVALRGTRACTSTYAGKDWPWNILPLRLSIVAHTHARGNFCSTCTRTGCQVHFSHPNTCIDDAMPGPL